MNGYQLLPDNDPQDSDAFEPREASKLPEWMRDFQNEISFSFCLLLGAMVWFVEIPELSHTAIHLLSVFIVVMTALMATSYPIAMVVGLALCYLAFTQNLQCPTRTGGFVECNRCGMPDIGSKPGSVFECHGLQDGLKVAFSGFGNPTAWLITSAFHIGSAVETTCLGKRIALVLMSLSGNSPIGLSYALLFSELVLAPFIPSNTARGGGIILPIVRSIIVLLESTPTSSPAAGRMLIFTGAHANLLISSLFLTGAAPNPIVASAVKRVLGIELGFFSWAWGAFLPCAVCIAALPWLFYALERPCGTTSDILHQSQLQLKALGPMSFKEIRLCFILVGALALWITAPSTGIPEALVAFMALISCLYLRVIAWKDVMNDGKAWDTLFWLGGMLVLAEQLTALGASKWIGNLCATAIASMGLSATVSAILLSAAYFGSSLFFSSITGHTVALAGPFLEAGKKLGCPKMALSFLISFFSSLGACMTHFSTGSVAMYFAQGFVSQRYWMCVGMLVACLYLSVYFTIGLGWFKLIGQF